MKRANTASSFTDQTINSILEKMNGLQIKAVYQNNVSLQANEIKCYTTQYACHVVRLLLINHVDGVCQASI